MIINPQNKCLRCLQFIPKSHTGKRVTNEGITIYGNTQNIFWCLLLQPPLWQPSTNKNTFGNRSKALHSSEYSQRQIFFGVVVHAWLWEWQKSIRRKAKCHRPVERNRTGFLPAIPSHIVTWKRDYEAWRQTRGRASCRLCDRKTLWVFHHHGQTAFRESDNGH